MGRNLKSLEIHPEIVGLLELERESGITQTVTIEAAVFWYCNALSSHERELARTLCMSLKRTGKTPDMGTVGELEEILRATKARTAKLRRSGSRSP